jgi:hypothetical protein
VGQEAFDARIAIRDQLLGAIIEHLRPRDAYMAQLADRIVGVVRANDDRIEASGVLADIKAFAAMDRSRGKAPKPSAFLRETKRDLLMTIGCLHSVLGGYPGRPTPAEWEEVIQETWRECFPRGEALDAKSVISVLRMRTIAGKALRLVYWATRPRRQRQERFVDFRKQLSRQKLRPHPWIVE